MSEIIETINTSNIAEIIETSSNIAEKVENTLNTEPTVSIKADYSTLFIKFGRPKMKPEDKKPRKRRSKKQPVTMEIEAVELKDHLAEKIHKLEVLKGQWNEYYRKNRGKILCRKKELREAKERMLNESMGVVKVEKRGRKRSGGVFDRERVCGLKCLSKFFVIR
jgi:hypothetical protein